MVLISSLGAEILLANAVPLKHGKNFGGGVQKKWLKKSLSPLDWANQVRYGLALLILVFSILSSLKTDMDKILSFPFAEDFEAWLDGRDYPDLLLVLETELLCLQSLVITLERMFPKDSNQCRSLSAAEQKIVLDMLTEDREA